MVERPSRTAARLRAVRLALAVALLCALLVAPAAARAAGPCGSTTARPWCDTSLSPDARAARLLARLTPDERIALLGGDEYLGVARAGEDDYTGTSDGVPRLGLPTMHYGDGPVGVREGQSTAMPIPMGVAASFDPRLARLHGRTIADEAKLKGNDVVYAPTVNILRTPLWGRAFETYGEDPLLSGRTAVAWIRGAQSTGVIADVKHYAANNQEGAGEGADEARPGQPAPPPSTRGSRFTVNVNVTERALREIYFPAFRMAVRDAHVGTVMCSYPKVRGTYACESSFLMKKVLRREWGFRGFVLADYGAAHNAGPSLRGGLDFEPWPALFHAYEPAEIRAALLTGQASMKDVSEHVRAILRTMFAYGVFDRAPYTKRPKRIDRAGHLRRARRIEEGAITLLRNRRGALPLTRRRPRSIAVIGRPAAEFTTGGGSANVKPYEYLDPLAAIRRRAGAGVKVRYDDGSDPASAAALARKSDVALVFAADYQTEFADRRCISLECPPWNGDQDGLIAAVAAANRRTVVVLETGGPVLTPWRNRVAAIVEAWYPGSAGGAAIARVLFGDVDPGGRLPATFPRSESQYPYAGDEQAYPGVADQVHYKEGIFVGYRWFDSRRLKPAFPFGFGRSYTRWRLDRARLRGRSVTARVRNVGRRRGSTVVQLYLGLPSSGAVPEPPRQLRGYRKVTLRPGRSKVVRFQVSDRDLSHWSTAAGGWRIAPGRWRVWVGLSSRNVRRASARVAARP